ncbi:MAG: ZIP family metal transporter [Acetivibrio sp.]
MIGIFWAFLGTCFTFSITALGAFNVFFMKKKMNTNFQSLCLGFAGGVMIAASIWSLLIPAIESAEENGQIGWAAPTGGFLTGVLLLFILDEMIKKRMKKSLCILNLDKGTGMLLLAITIHNIPEGMAVGLGFALAAQNPENPAYLTGAIALAIGIGIQNYPEGTAVALPLYQAGMKKGRAFLAGSMSAIVEPIFGVLAAMVSGAIRLYMPCFLSFAAGAMIYVVIEELIPEAHAEGKEKTGTLGFVAGFVIMMILDVALA